MNKQTSVKSKETIKDENMTLLLMLSYNKMKMYNENFSNLPESNKMKNLPDCYGTF